MQLKKAMIIVTFFLVFISCATLTPKDPISLFSDATPTFPSSSLEKITQENPTNNLVEINNRFHPYPPGKLFEIFTLNIEIEKVVKGDTAWRMIEAENQFNDPAPKGMQYVLVKIYVENTLNGGIREINRYDFRLSGSEHIRYNPASIVPPAPELQAEIRYGESTTGWIPFLVTENETGLTLIADLLSFNIDDGEVISYFSLDDKDLLTRDEDVSFRPPTIAGDSFDNPAQVDELTSSSSWDVTISNLIRGELAYEKIIAANQFNDPPPEGMEYVLFWVTTEYFSAGDEFGLINNSWFETYDINGTKYETISVVKPLPELRSYLFDGGIGEGWVALLVERGQSFVIKIDPLFDYEEFNNRYVLIN